MLLEKLSFITEGEIKIFHNNLKLKKFMSSNSALQKIIKELLHTEEEDKCNHEK
jgi:hypothetical protein